MRQLVVTVPAEEVELASDALWRLGVMAVEERVTGELVELWTSLGDPPPPALDLGWPHRFVDVDEAIADTWRDFAAPSFVEPDLVVRPAWVPFESPPGIVVITIEPGSTFGMGDHPTTRLSLAAARRWVRHGSRVLDVGCGSGVLAIGAMRFGASRAVAVDIAPAAVPITLANAAANGVEVDVSTTPLDQVDGEFDVVLANILAPTLIALADDLRRLLAADGVLVISGILAGAHANVLEALAPLEVVSTDTLDHWAAVTLRRPSAE